VSDRDPVGIRFTRSEVAVREVREGFLEPHLCAVEPTAVRTVAVGTAGVVQLSAREPVEILGELSCKILHTRAKCAHEERHGVTHGTA
jgi:hypothetical protein